MEGIVCGIANINFRQTALEFRDENRTPNCMQNTQQTADMALLNEASASSPANLAFPNLYDPNETVASSSSNDDEWQTDDEALHTLHKSKAFRRRSGGGSTFAEKRQLPSRASKDNFLSGIKRRTIMKPAKHTSSLSKDFNNLKPAEIKKIYLNKKLTNFRPSSLETIFEEPANSQAIGDEEEHEQVRFIGSRKLRRTLNCTDGFVFNKALVKKRRAKIKKTFGRRLSLKKISLEDFLEKLNSSMEKAASPEEDNEKMEESACFTNQPLQVAMDSKALMPLKNIMPITDAFINIPISTSAIYQSPKPS
ncbi:protein tantalus [Stomoxys calcitrans]|uniref:protein tantalus n=1 Tax=Stomoxys calcitrans TaxID=35570 RepID=UPI0027E2BF37|nr:protein tantalus [Stomoxys calcitrans]